MSANDKFKHAFWILFNIMLIGVCGWMAFLMPVMNAMEDEKTSALSLTSSGRLQIAWQSAAGVLFMSVFPAGLGYLIGRLLGVNGSQIVRVNNGLKMVLLVWVALVVCGLMGAICFWLRIHPLQPN